MQKLPPNPLFEQAPPVPEHRDVDPARFAAEIAGRYAPAVLRGLVADWPAVAAGRGTEQETADYLARFDRGMAVKAFVAPPEVGGRFGYRPDVAGYNFAVVDTNLATLLARLLAIAGKENAEGIYMGSVPAPHLLPGFEEENPLPHLAAKPTGPRIWIGNSTRIGAHFDEQDNVACVVRGPRRFILFPPEAVKNLHVGPLDRTPAGQPSSLVDFSAPDFDRYPRFRDAIAQAMVTELAPGDAIFIPSLWWHHVEAAGPLNILVNYWWSDLPADADSPFHVLAHGLHTLAHLPEPRREAWRALFDHYVFRRNGDPADHIPPAARSILGPSTPPLRRHIRAFLMNVLGRGG